jgi:hypothetical protein
LVDFPDNASRHSFLSAQEVRFCIARINADRGDAVAEPFALRKFLAPALDLKVWGLGLIFGMTTTVSYALAYFLPIILNKGLGFSIAKSQCLVAPPYAAAALWMYGQAWFADKHHIRGPILVANALLAILGVCVLGFAKPLGVRYFGCFLVCMGKLSSRYL